MCDFHHDHGLPHLEADEYVLDTPFVRAFVADVRARIEIAGSAGSACEAIEPLFTDLLADPGWLPEAYQRDAPASGMGGGIGQWLLFRAADRSLCLFSLVVPPGSMTPIHDHLAWGLIGLYRGNQDEEFYRPTPDGLDLVRRRPLEPGDFYRLIPRATTSTASGRPRTSPPSRSTCSQATPAASSATPTTRRPARLGPSGRATSTPSARDLCSRRQPPPAISCRRGRCGR